MGWTWNGIEHYCVPNTAQDSTLRPSGTLLFSWLPMMIWQKNLQTDIARKRSGLRHNFSVKSKCHKVSKYILTSFSILELITCKLCKDCSVQINLEAKSMHESSWKKDSIISVFILVFAGQVLFTMNGLNWSQSWQVLICFLKKKFKSLKY